MSEFVQAITVAKKLLMEEQVRIHNNLLKVNRIGKQIIKMQKILLKRQGK